MALGGKHAILALLLTTNLCWIVFLANYTTEQQVMVVHKEPSCQPVSLSEGQLGSKQQESSEVTRWAAEEVQGGAATVNEPSGTSEDMTEQKEMEEVKEARQMSRSSVEAAQRKAMKTVRMRDSWYNNGLLLPSDELPRLPSDQDCSSYEAVVTAYGSHVPSSSSIGILWPRGKTYHHLLLDYDFTDMPVYDVHDNIVADVMLETRLYGSGAGWPATSKNLDLRFRVDSAIGCDAYEEVVEHPHPVWVVELAYGFSATYAPDVPDSVVQQLTDVRIILRRANVPAYDVVHIFNPYTPRPGSHQELELTVVHRMLEVAYNRAWAQGIRVLLLAAVFEEDMPMVHYPYRSTGRPLYSHFLDHMGRKIPLMSDILELLWEEAVPKQSYIFTNADIAVQPDFYESIVRKYSVSSSTHILLREQIPLQFIDTDEPIEVEHLNHLAIKKGLEHSGDDCFIIPPHVLPSVRYGAVFPAYPPFACFWKSQLDDLFGGSRRLRAKETYHLGIDIETSIWLKDPSVLVGRHVNVLNAMEEMKSFDQEVLTTSFRRKCLIDKWCAGGKVSGSMLEAEERPKLNCDKSLPSFAVLRGKVAMERNVTSGLGPHFPTFAYGRLSDASAQEELDDAIPSDNDKLTLMKSEMTRRDALALGSPAGSMGLSDVGSHRGLPVFDPPSRITADQLTEISARARATRELIEERSQRYLPAPWTQPELPKEFQDWLTPTMPPMNELVASLMTRGVSMGRGVPLQLVECVTSGMTGIRVLDGLLHLAEGVGGGLEREPLMTQTHLQMVLSRPLAESLPSRDAKMAQLLREWRDNSAASTFLDLNNMFIKTYSDVVMESEWVDACRTSGSEQPVVQVVVLRRSFLALVRAQVARGWFGHGLNDQRGIWYYALEDVIEPSRIILPYIPSPVTKGLTGVIDLAIGYNYDIEMRARAFIDAYKDDPCVNVVETSLESMAEPGGAKRLLSDLHLHSSETEAHLSEYVRDAIDEYYVEEREREVASLTVEAVQHGHAAFVARYTAAGYDLPPVILE